MVEHDLGDLVRLRRHQPPPDGIALRPEILALVIKTLTFVVHDYTETDTIQTGYNTAIETRAACINCDSMALAGITDGVNALIDQAY